MTSTLHVVNFAYHASCSDKIFEVSFVSFCSLQYRKKMYIADEKHIYHFLFFYHISVCFTIMNTTMVSCSNHHVILLHRMQELPHIELSLCYHAMLGFATVDVIAVRNVPKGSLGRYRGKQSCWLISRRKTRFLKSWKNVVVQKANVAFEKVCICQGLFEGKC